MLAWLSFSPGSVEKVAKVYPAPIQGKFSCFSFTLSPTFNLNLEFEKSLKESAVVKSEVQKLLNSLPLK